MWKKNNFCFGLIMLFHFGFSQEKKVDTVYVYEEIIIRDTVYIEKPLNKIKANTLIVNEVKKGFKPSITIIQNNQKTVISADTLVIEHRKNSLFSDWKFGAKFQTGFISSSLLKEFDLKNQPFLGFGIFVKKRIFSSNFYVGTGFESSFLIQLSQTKDSISSLNGFYFTNDGGPKLFKSINAKGFQFQIPVQFYLKLKKFTPSIGFFGTFNKYESKFLGSNGTILLTLNELQTFNAESVFIGYLAQLEYEIFEKWSIGLNYSFATAKKLVFNRNDESFAINKKQNLTSFGISILYNFSN
jgi:hypothetical protein